MAQNISKDKLNSSRFIGALTLGAVAGVFIGLMAMALAILSFGLLRLLFPDLIFQVAGMSATAVIFVVFCAIGWVGSTMVIWHKLPIISVDS